MTNLKWFFKIPLSLKENWEPIIKEVKYKWADWKEYAWLEFKWFASTIDLDRWWDVVLPSAFEKQLPEYMENAQLLLQHDDDKPIWNITKAEIKEEWLFVEWLVKIDTEEIFMKIKTWVLKTMSIWYRIKDFEFKETEIDGETKEMFVIKELDLFEISIVSVPMNQNAKFKKFSDLNKKQIKEYFDLEKEDKYPLNKSIKDLIEKENEEWEGKEKQDEAKEKEDIKKETEIKIEKNDEEKKETEKQDETEIKQKDEETKKETEQNNTESEIKKFEKQLDSKFEKLIADSIEAKKQEMEKNLETQIKDLKKSYDDKIDLFCKTLIEALDILEKSNIKAENLVKKLENTSITKSYRYEEKKPTQTKETSLWRVIKQIKSNNL